MKYLQKSFLSQPSSEEYRKGFETTFSKEEPVGSSLLRCSKCGTYFAKKSGENICPNCNQLHTDSYVADYTVNIKKICNGLYHVQLTKGKWPNDEVIINLCKESFPPSYFSVSGEVVKETDGKSARVSLWQVR